MTKTQELLELAERVEKATGPDRELDAEIGSYLASTGTFSCWGCDDPLRFTASLDSAMTLVPEGVPFSLGSYGGRSGYFQASIGVGGGPYVSATPALALCAAALRARSQS